MVNTISFSVNQPLASLSSAAKKTKEKAMEQFEKNLDRLKECFNGKCTKQGALRIARNVGIAAVIAIIALYAGGTILHRGVADKPESKVYHAGTYMRAPGTVIKKGAAMAGKKVAKSPLGRRVYPFQKGDRVKWEGEGPYTVKSYNPFTNKVTLDLGHTIKAVGIDAEEFELIP